MSWQRLVLRQSGRKVEDALTDALDNVSEADPDLLVDDKGAHVVVSHSVGTGGTRAVEVSLPGACGGAGHSLKGWKEDRDI